MTKDGEAGRKKGVFSLLAAASIFVLLSILGGFLYWGEGREEGEAESLCEGYIDPASLAPLPVEGDGRYDSSFTELRDASGKHADSFSKRKGLISRCTVRKGAEGIASFEVLTAWKYGPYRAGPTAPSWYSYASPIGSGVSGWTGESRAQVWLPDACSRKFGTGREPVQVQLEIDGSLEENWSSDETRRRMAEVLMGYAKGIAQEKGCDSGDFRLTEEVPGASSFERVPGEAQCGVPGFTATRPGANREKLKQRVVGDFKDSWSCVLTRENGSDDPYVLPAFAVTRNDQLVDRYDRSQSVQSENFQVERIECRGASHLVLMSYGYPYGDKPPEREKRELEFARSELLPKDSLYEGFLDAVKPMLGCSS